MALRRQFGFVDDTTAGGTAFDALSSGAIPDPDTFWPIQTATVTDGRVDLDRNDEIRGVRGRVEPEPFKRAPSVNLKGRLYAPIAKKLNELMTGSAGTVTGTSPAVRTRKFEPVEGVDVLPAVHLALVNDDQYRKIAGCQLDSCEYTFPIDGAATFDATLVGLYEAPDSGTVPAAAYTDNAPDWSFKLRDAQALIAGAVSGIDGLASFTLKYENQFTDPEFWPKREREIVPAAGGNPEAIIWWPHIRRMGFDRAVTGSISFSTVKAAEEAAARLARARQFVFECEAELLATTPAARRLLRITGTRGVYTGGGASQLQKEGRASSQYDLGLFLDPTTGKDVKFELTEV